MGRAREKSGLPEPALAKRRRWWWRRSRGVEPTPVLVDSGVCAGCGYSLDGLASWRDEDAVCPECGISMVRARLGSDLPMAAAESLARLSRGMRLVSYGVGASIVIPILSLLTLTMISSAIDAATGVSISSVLLFDILVFGFLIGGPLVGFVLWCVGWRLVARAFEDRRLAGSRPGVAMGLLASLAGSVGAVLGAVVFGLLDGAVWARGLPEASSALAVSLVFVSAGLGIWLLRGVAARASDRRIRTGMTQLLVTSPLLVVGPVLLAYQRLFGGPHMDTWGGVITCFGILWVFSFLGFVGRLEKVVDAARAARVASDTSDDRSSGVSGQRQPSDS